MQTRHFRIRIDHRLTTSRMVMGVFAIQNGPQMNVVPSKVAGFQRAMKYGADDRLRFEFTSSNTFPRPSPRPIVAKIFERVFITEHVVHKSILIGQHKDGPVLISFIVVGVFFIFMLIFFVIVVLIAQSHVDVSFAFQSVHTLTKVGVFKRTKRQLSPTLKKFGTFFALRFVRIRIQRNANPKRTQLLPQDAELFRHVHILKQKKENLI